MSLRINTRILYDAFSRLNTRRKNQIIVAVTLTSLVTVSLGLAWGLLRPPAQQPPGLSEQKLVIGSTSDFPPFDMLNSDGNHVGYAFDISTAVANELGYDYEYKIASTWVQLVDWLKNDEVYLIHLIAYSSERDEYFDFTIPHTLVPEVIYVRSERLDIHTLDDLEDKKNGAVRQHITHQKLMQYDYISWQHISSLRV